MIAITPGAYWRSAKSAPFATRILVACARGDVMIAVRAEYMGWMRDVDGSGIFDVVTHWRPLPEHPANEKPLANDKADTAIRRAVSDFLDRERKQWAAEDAVNRGAKP
jgi:hypothetical protein